MPQPRSSTLASGRDEFDDRVVVQPVAGVEDARRAVDCRVAVVRRLGRRLRGRFPPAVEIRQKRPDHLPVDRQFVGQQERIVAAVALDVAVADRLARRRSGASTISRDWKAETASRW